jgi:ParB-like chromosome segregation protein Spo0J
MQPDPAVVTMPVASLVPYAENARTHSDSQVAQIAASIAEFGFVNPVLVDAAGVLVAGHGRVMAAKRLGMAAVPANWRARTPPVGGWFCAELARHG